MSKILDERVVSMQFDNAQFEKNVGTSLSTLDKLQKKLNLTGMSKGLESVDAAAKKCNFAPMSNGIETVRLKFSAMYTTADHYFRKLLTTVDNFATKFVKSLTIDPVKTGLKEYETQIGAIQTILANTESKGTTLDDVNAALDELNKYADMTIYNFTEMTRNIGTFTAAGVDLDTSVSAIKGIANLAAVSGSTSQQASTAMYQLSQALAAGRVSLMDWNSVVNAGMGGEVFQNALKRTARAMGTDVDAIIAKYGSFRESLTQGEWLTTDVLTKTLEQFTMAAEEGSEQWNEFKKSLMDDGYTEKQAEEILKMANTATDAATKVKTVTQLIDVLKETAQSGWTQTWEYIIGDFEQAKEMWTAVSDELTGLINKMSEIRNNFLLGGEQNSDTGKMEYFANAGLMSNYDKLIKKINEAGVSTESFEETVKKTAKEHGYPIDRMIENYGDLETAIRNNQLPTEILNEALENLSGTAADLSKIDTVLDFGDTGDNVKEMQQALVDLGYNLNKYGIDGIIGEETTAAIKAFQEANGLEITGILDEATLNALKEATKGVEGLSGECAELIANIDNLGGRELLVEAFANAWAAVKDVFGGVKEAWREVFPAKSVEEKSMALYKVIESIHGFSEKLLENEEVVDNLKRTFKGLFSVLEIVKTILGGGISLAFKVLTGVLDNFDLNILDVTAAIGDALTKVRDWIFENEVINKGFDLLVDGIAAGVTAIRDWIKAFLKLPKVSKALTGIKDFFSGGFDRISSFIDRFKKLKDLGDIDWGAVFKDFKTNVIGYFTNFEYGGVFKGIKLFFTNLKNKISEYFDNFDIASSFTVAFDRIKDFFSGGFDRISSFIDRFKKLKDLGDIDWGAVFKDFKTNVIGYFTNFDFSGILDGIKTFFTNLKNGVSAYFVNFDIKGTFIAVIEKIKTFFSDLFKSIGIWFDGLNLGTSFDTVKSKISGAFEFIKSIIPTLIAIAAGVATFYGIFKTIGFIKDVLSPIANITEAVNNISDSIEGLAKAKSRSIQMQALGQMLLMIGGSILIIAKAIEMLGNLDKSALIQGGVAVGIIAGVIAGMMFLSKFLADGYKSFEFGSMVVKIAASIFVLAYAIKMLGNMDSSVLEQGMSVLTKFLIGMVGMMAATKFLGDGSADFGKMMFKLASSLLMMALVIKILGGMDRDTLIQGGIAITAFMGIMTLMMLATKLLAKDKTIGNSKTTNTFMQFGKMMLVLSASLLLMAAAVAILGKMDRDTLIQGGLAITAFLGMMVGMMAATKLLAKDMPKFAGTIAGLGVSLLLMTASVAILGNMDTSTIVKGTIAVGALLGLIVGMMAATKLIGNNAKDAGKVGVMMLAFSGAMILMAGAIKILSGINTKDLAAATLAISAVGGMFAVMTKMTKYIKGKTMGTLIVLIAAVGLLATALYVLSGFDTKKLLGASTALTMVMGAFAVMTVALKAITSKSSVINAKTLGTLGLMAGIVAALGYVVYLLAKNIDDPDGALKSAIALSAIIIALSGACAALSIASKYAPKTKTGFVALAGVMALIGGFSAIAIWQLPNVAKQLSAFMEELEPFIKGVQGMTPSFLYSLKTLAEAMLILTGAGGIFAISDTFTLGGVGRAFDSFKTFIKEAVPIVKDIALEVSGKGVTINTANLKAIVEAIKGIAEAASLVPKDIMFGGIFGKSRFGIGAYAEITTNLTGFTNFIKTAVEAVASFMEGLYETNDKGKKITKFNSDDLKILDAVCNAIKALSEAANNVPSDVVADLDAFAGGGGFKKFGLFIGGGTVNANISKSTNLTGFANFIGLAISALTTFMEDLSVTGEDGTKVMKFNDAELKFIEPICNAITTIAQAASTVPSDVVAEVKALGGGLAGGSGGKFNKFGIFAGGGKVDAKISKSTDLTGFANFIGLATAALTTFMDDLSITKRSGKKVMKFGDEELAFIEPICNAITTIAQAADSVPSDVVAEVNVFVGGGGGGFGPFKKFGVFAGGGMADASGQISKSKDLTGFANFIGSATSALVTFMDDLSLTDTEGNKITDAEGKRIMKFCDEELAFIEPICNAITAIAQAASDVPSNVVADLSAFVGGGGGGFGPFKKFGVFGGGGIADINGNVSKTTDLEGFAGFITSGLTAVTSFMDILTAVDDEGKRIRNFSEADLGVVTALANALGAIGKSVEFVPSIVNGTFGGSGGGGSLGLSLLKKGLNGGGGGGSFSGEFSVTPMLDEYKGWITDTLTALAEFTTTLKGADGQAAITTQDAETVVKLCEAVSALGGAMEHVPSRADFDIDLEGIFGGGGLSGLIVGGFKGKAEGSVVPMLTQFKGWIKDILDILPDFALEMSDIVLTEDNITAINALCTAVDTLAQASANAPKTTECDMGIFGSYIESTDLSKLTEWAATIIPLMTQIASGTFVDEDGNAVTLEDVNLTNVYKLKSIAQAAKIIAEAAKLAPQASTYEGIFGTWTDSTDIEKTVDWFKNVYEMINGTDGLLTKIAANPPNEENMLQLTAIADLAHLVSETIWNVAIANSTKTVDTTTFTQSIDCLWAFYEQLKIYLDEGMDLEVITRAVNNISTLTNALTAVQNFSQWTSEGGEINTTAINNALKDLVTSIDAFADSMATITDPTTAISQLRELSGVIGGLTTISFAGASSFKTALEDLSTTGIEAFIEKFDTSSDDVQKAANGLVDEAASAIETESNYEDMKSAGKYLGKGLVKGIEDKYDDVYNAAYKLGQKAVQGEKDGQASNSPSKLTIKAGHWFGEGLVIGIGQMGSAVYSSAHSLGETAISSISSTVSKISEAINTDIDTQPTIRPVLDLSDVTAGAGTISGLLNMNPSVGVLSNVGTINTMMNNRQNGTNTDVVSAINDLRKSLGNASNNTYNINGVTYDDGSNISDAVKTLVRAARVERRI